MPRTRTDSSPRVRTRPASLLLAFAAALVLLCAAYDAAAGASAGIVGVWEFEHGEIAVQPAAANTFEGIVVQTTTFAECAHAEGEHIWKDMTPQSDGSFWGDHQWLFEKSCLPNEVPGPTAWRVKEEAGRTYLRVCFSNPGTTQPEIPASGPETGVTYGCVDSKLTAALPIVAGPGGSGGSGGSTTPSGTPAS